MCLLFRSNAKNFMRLKIFFLHFFHVLNLFSFAQIEIKGVLPGAENRIISVHAPADLVSFRQMHLGACLVDDSSGFELEITLSHRSPVILEIGYYTYQFYAIPGKKYFLRSDSLNLKNVYRPFYNKQVLPCSLEEKPGLEINHELYKIDTAFNSFILANFGGIYQNRRAGIFTPFKQKIKQQMDSVNEPFVKAYAEYKIAATELAVIPQKKKLFFKSYLLDKPVLYTNTEYMQFVKTYFEDIPQLNNRFVSRDDLFMGINYLDHYSALLDSLGKDTLLRNEQLRELVMLFTLKDLFSNTAYSKYQINRFFEQINEESKFEHHRKIAKNLKFELNDLKKGTPAKYFNLPGLLSDSLALDQLKGKPVYLGFFTTWSYACLAELEGLQNLYKTYGDRIHFVTIMLDENIEIARRLVQEKDYSWTFLYNGTAYPLLNDYRVKTFPSFILLDQNLMIEQYPAYKPSEVIEEEFKKLLMPPKE